MFQNNIPNSLPSVERLINRISVAEKSQQREIRISISEAKEIMTDLALMTSKLNKTVTDIHKMLLELKDSSTNIEVKVDGGGFNQR